MVEKPKAPDEDNESNESKSDLTQLATTIRDSAQQIWLAGLGAFSRAQDEGSKVFETLAREGLDIQRRTRAATGERLGSVGEKMSRAAGGFSRQATQSWDRLEQGFEDRVLRALARMGVPSSREIDELVARVDTLNEAVQSLESKVRRAARKTSAAKTSARARKTSTRAEKPADTEGKKTS